VDSAEVSWLREFLETVDEFGRASLGLVAWELSLEEDVLRPALQYALTRGLLIDPVPSPETGELEYRLGSRALPLVRAID
jgi:hypothetical protein